MRARSPCASSDGSTPASRLAPGDVESIAARPAEGFDNRARGDIADVDRVIAALRHELDDLNVHVMSIDAAPVTPAEVIFDRVVELGARTISVFEPGPAP